MIKYSVYTDHFEDTFDFSWTEEEIADAYYRKTANDPRLVKMCDTLEEARQVLGDEQGYTTVMQGNAGKYMRFDIAYIDEAEWEEDEDGELVYIMGENIWDFRCEAFGDKEEA